jgi:hypothetical protein
LLRGAGLRLGELLDLELDSVVDYGPAGSWLRVPLGKLGTERSVRRCQIFCVSSGCLFERRHCCDHA